MVDKATVQKAIQAALDGAPERKFGESVDLAFNLKNIDLAIPKNRVDEEVLLPKGRGRVRKVAVFAGGELAVKAREVADLVVMPEEIETLADDKRKARKIANDMAFFVSEAPLMPTIGRTLGVVLGPRGKMPRPIPPNADPAGVVSNLRNTVRVRSRDRRTFHAAIGTRDMSADDLAENAMSVLDRILKKLERGQENIDSLFVKTTMGPAERIL